MNIMKIAFGYVLGFSLLGFVFSSSVFADPQEDLFNGIQSGKSDLVRSALTDGASLESTKGHTSGYTPLQLASRTNNVEMMRLLIDLGADPSLRNPESGLTPLHTAAKFNLVDAATLLIKHRADVDAQDFQGNTAVYLAAKGGNRPVFYLLAKAGANLERANSDGDTPGQVAARDGRSLDASKYEYNVRRSPAHEEILKFIRSIGTTAKK